MATTTTAATATTPTATQIMVETTATKTEDATTDDDITQNKVNRGRRRRAVRDERSEASESDRDSEPCGALCFRRAIRETRMPEGFKLNSTTHKYDGLEAPEGCMARRLPNSSKIPERHQHYSYAVCTAYAHRISKALVEESTTRIHQFMEAVPLFFYRKLQVNIQATSLTRGTKLASKDPGRRCGATFKDGPY